jgi:hypothetical protein
MPKDFKDLNQSELELDEQRRCRMCGSHIESKNLDDKFCSPDCKDDWEDSFK